MLRTHFDNDPNGTVPYAAIKIDGGVLLYINAAVLERVDTEMRQYLANSILTELDKPDADNGARIIDLCEARLRLAPAPRKVSLAGVGVMAAAFMPEFLKSVGAV